VLVDFHSHTDASDGSLPAAALMAAMRTRGVAVCSITDHDTVAAHDLFAASPTVPRLVSGVEINTTWRGDEVHVLGYGFSLAAQAPLRRTMRENVAARRARVERIVAQLNAAGIAIAFADVEREAGRAHSLGRPHVAKALVRRGAVRDVERAFRTLLARDGPGYVAADHVRPHDAIAVIREAGGVAVLAHPGRLRDLGVLPELVEAGLGGLEVFYPAHGPGQVSYFRGLATRYGLVMTAGSDFHDVRWNVAGVGIEVERDDIRPFLDLVA
jgi:predicted metal-dependent phosphoesterase TrpH